MKHFIDKDSQRYSFHRNNSNQIQNPSHPPSIICASMTIITYVACSQLLSPFCVQGDSLISNDQHWCSSCAVTLQFPSAHFISARAAWLCVLCWTMWSVFTNDCGFIQLWLCGEAVRKGTAFANMCLLWRGTWGLLPFLKGSIGNNMFFELQRPVGMQRDVLNVLFNGFLSFW